jgi:hypothetical protein
MTTEEIKDFLSEKYAAKNIKRTSKSKSGSGWVRTYSSDQGEFKVFTDTLDSKIVSVEQDSAQQGSKKDAKYNPINYIECKSCGSHDVFFIVGEDGRDGFQVHADGEGLSGESAHNLDFMFYDCHGECEDETDAIVYFKDGTVLEDEAAWDYFIKNNIIKKMSKELLKKNKDFEKVEGYTFSVSQKKLTFGYHGNKTFTTYVISFFDLAGNNSFRFETNGAFDALERILDNHDDDWDNKRFFQIPGYLSFFSKEPNITREEIKSIALKHKFKESPAQITGF